MSNATATTPSPSPPPNPPQTTLAPTTHIDTIITTASASSRRVTTTVITSTSVPSATASAPHSKISRPSSTGSLTSSSSSASDTSPTAAVTGGGRSGGGLNGTTRVVVAVVVPIIGVALIAIGLLFLWKQRQKRKADAEARRKEVEEYGYNPNQNPHGGAIAGAAAARGIDGEPGQYEMAESEATGYRGWGSTNGGRKLSGMGSSVATSQQPLSPVGMGFSEGGYNRPLEGPDGYAGVATSPSASNFPAGNTPSTDGHSLAPLINCRGNPPSTADSSVIGAMNGPQTADNSEGIHRGISNASSNYSAVTHSTKSDRGQPLSHHDAQYYGADAVYDDGYYYSNHPPHQYSDDAGSAQVPVIRDVQARRNTRIETPTNTHFPQQGNTGSGIAQNF
ncbi:unnamed protein product [Tuber melanosporum]|uniref:(Perigord truffle) hypothetical protein n=1 Tax=Tuber melanosporum (strain Mel28) TaxID=656061 RepID=D5G3Z4_TUBMM|nr:uncharacterized protein GSTUM_00003874001 [Tuber melanosporum]CAZ79237.1 unnamed protein product [Tuber melanosporum]